MRMVAYKKVKIGLLSCLIFLTAVCCAVLGGKMLTPVSAKAEEVTVNRTLQSGEFQTNGASMRVFRKTSTGGLEETAQQGIRFHVEMGSGYKYGTTALFDGVTKNERGSWTIAEGFKTYTLILPKRLLSGDLTVNSAKVMKLDTTDYWFSDGNGNIESTAYVYKVPEGRRTDTFCFKGIICTVAADGTETVVAQTETGERCLADVAKAAYEDTMNPNTILWGTEENPLDEIAAPLLKAFVPTWTISYKVGGTVVATEEVLWGDKPEGAPEFSVTEGEHIQYDAAWFDTGNNVEFNVNAEMDSAVNKALTLVSASATEFNVTGIADYNNFVVNEDTTLYSGAKLYATIPCSGLYTADEIANGTDKRVELAKDGLKLAYNGKGSFKGVQGVWAMMEGKGDGAQLRIVLAFDSTTMESGDELTLQEGSVLYANGMMYRLSQEYPIDYSVVNGVEDYGVFLGYLYNSDVKRAYNWIETTDANRKRIRVEFNKDVFINSDFKIVYDGELPEGYPSPLYMACNQTGNTPITQGYYYWNDGQYAILELEGYGEHGDEILYGAPGLKIVQNGGYFIFKDAIKWENNGTKWIEGKEKGTFNASSFDVKSKYQDGETRFVTTSTALTAGGTTDRWFNDVYKINVENMSETAPYAVFVTKTNGDVVPLNDFRYHGQATGSGYNHIFAIHDYKGEAAGETITILGGTRFWYGSEYYTATEDIVFYYNGINWVSNHDGVANQEITMEDFAGQLGYNYFEANTNRVRMHLATQTFNGAFGRLIVESGSVKVNGRAYTTLEYHGGVHKIFEIIGDSLAPIGQTAFEDTLVIEAGTRIWIGINDGATADPYCIEFPERLEWLYVGKGMRDGSGNHVNYEWIKTDNNTDITHADITGMGNANDASADVRLYLVEGILTDNFYGYMAMETEKGVPVVNGVEKPDLAFSYGQGNKLFGVRGGDLGTKLGDYIIIPKGSVWWSTQGSLTFVEEIYAIWNPWAGAWSFGFNLEDCISEINTQDVARVMNEGSDEIRLQIPRGISDTYYGPIALKGDAYVEKVDGTVVSCGLAYWYSGAGYQASHTLIGMRAVGLAGAQNGDTLTIKAGTKFVFPNGSGISGYHVFDEDIVYIYQNGNWRSSEGWKVTFNFANATVAVDGKTIQSGETVSMYDGTQKIAVTAANGYSIVGVNGATNNMDGTYSIRVSSDMTVSVVAKKSVKLGANAIYVIGKHAEGNITGVRINLDEAAYAELNNITGVNNYGMSMNGATSIVLNGTAASFSANSPYNYFGAEAGSLFEMRFDTANLKAGDNFTIKAGTVFNHANMAYAIEFTEDIIGYWTGTQWVVNPTKAGEIDWSEIVHIASYSDPGTYTIRIYLPNELFGGATGALAAEGVATINGIGYTGVWRYHGSGNKILEVSEWEYKKDDVLVIPAGMRFYLGSSYYEVTKTLTATCSADGAGQAWPWQVS